MELNHLHFYWRKVWVLSSYPAVISFVKRWNRSIGTNWFMRSKTQAMQPHWCRLAQRTSITWYQFIKLIGTQMIITCDTVYSIWCKILRQDIVFRWCDTQPENSYHKRKLKRDILTVHFDRSIKWPKTLRPTSVQDSRVKRLQQWKRRYTLKPSVEGLK